MLAHNHSYHSTSQRELAQEGNATSLSPLATAAAWIVAARPTHWAAADAAPAAESAAGHKNTVAQQRQPEEQTAVVPAAAAVVVPIVPAAVVHRPAGRPRATAAAAWMTHHCQPTAWRLQLAALP